MSDTLHPLHIRRAEVEDGREFNTLVNSLGGQALFRALFGQYNYTSLVEYAHLSLIATNDADACVCFAAFSDGGAGSSDIVPFDELLLSLTAVIPCRASNTLLLNFWALSDHLATEPMGQKVLQQAFAICPDVNYIIWVCARTVTPPKFLEENFARANLDGLNSAGSDSIKNVSVYILHRSKFLPQLLVRTAMVEDNDDLLPILMRSNSNIPKGAEDSFLAGLIQTQNDSNKLFVGVNKNIPVGMLATSTDINHQMLAQVFKLNHFPSLLFDEEPSVAVRSKLVFVLGDPRILGEIALKQMCDKRNVQLVDLGDVAVSAGSTKFCDTLKSKVRDLSEEIACVVTNAIRNEEDARQIVQSLNDGSLVLDAVIELQNLDDDLDLDAEEDYLGDILDGVEYLRQNVSGTPNDMKWRKITVDGAELQGKLYQRSEERIFSELRCLVDEYKEVGDAIRQSKSTGPKVNAFAISLFCMDDTFESRSEDLVRIAFEDYSLIDYCVLLVPNSAQSTALQSWMLPCPMKSGVSFDHSLFVCHRSTFLAKDCLSIERMTHDHMSSVRDFAVIVGDDIEDTTTSFQNSLRDLDVDLKNNPGEVTFVAVMEGVVVGYLSLSRKATTTESIALLRERYNIDDYVSFERHRGRSQAMITKWKMHPCFENWSRHVLRECMRMYHKTLLYVWPAEGENPETVVLKETYSAKPRRRETETEENWSEQLQRPLYFMTKKLLSSKKIYVTKRIVIIGGNQSSYSILETIIAAQNMYVGTLILIMESPPQPWSTDVDGGDDAFSGCLSLKNCDDYTCDEIRCLGLSSRVVMVQGRLTDIDRKNKAVIVSNETVVEYDVLIIAGPTQDHTASKLPCTAGIHPLLCANLGIFGLGNHVADTSAMNFVHSPTCKDKTIVVYGAGITALNVLGCLSQREIDMKRVIWVMPERNISEFENSNFNARIEQALSHVDEEGAQCIEFEIIRDAKLLDCVLTPDETSICSVSVRVFPGQNSIMGPKDITIDCGCLLLCGNYECDIDVFSAINDAGLIYDGGIVVNERFCSVDPHIYAVGDCTKFSRRFIDQIPHYRCNARELGRIVAQNVIVTCLDPGISLFSVSANSTNQNMRTLDNGVTTSFNELPTFHAPRSVRAVFPGNLQFFSSSLPQNIPNKNVGYLLTGPNADDGDRVSAVKFDSLGILREFAALGPAPNMHNVASIFRLVGWHESFLNSAIFAYETGNVRDWVAFFSDDWAAAIKFDRFPLLVQSLCKILQSDKGMLSILEKIFENAESTDDNDVICLARRNILGDRACHIPDATRSAVESHVLDFLRKYKDAMVSYSVPMPQKQSR